MESNTSQPDWQAKAQQDALEYAMKHPGMYPLTEREKLEEMYGDEIREERIRRRSSRMSRRDDEH